MNSIKKIILESTYKAIKQYHLINKNDKILIAFSGGADSLALLLILLKIQSEFNLTFHLVHINHKIRKKDSDQDEKFVKKVANQFHVPITIKSINIPALKKINKHQSLEEIAHQKRMLFFNSLLIKLRFNKIATGHHLDDNIENYFLKTFNGGSLQTLSGIKPVENNVIRPLLLCWKKDLIEFINSYKLDYCQDYTNNDLTYPRNWIRHKLIRYIENNYQPVKDNIAQLIEILFQENDYIKTIVQKSIKKFIINENFYTAIIKNNNINRHPAIVRRIIHYILEKTNAPLNHYNISLIEKFILNSTKNSLLINDFYTWKYNNNLFFSLSNYIKNFHYKIFTFPAIIKIPNLKLTIKITKIKKGIDNFENNIIYIGMDDLKEINIRNKKQNDYIKLMNTDYHIKLKKLFIDLKIPNPLKKMIPVIEANSEIIGIFLNIFPINLKNRISENYKITAKTKNILKMEFEQQL